MKQVLQNYKTGKLELAEVPAPALKSGGILVKNHYSLVSAGTEKAVIEFAKQSLASKARSRPDLAKQVLNKIKTDGLLSTYRAAMQRLDEPVPLGYSCAGEVIEVGRGAEEFVKGDLVACGGGGYASHAEVVFVPKNLVVRIPDNMSMKEAAFVTLGAIAMQGVRRAELTPGEHVAVIGLGLIGQLTVQILQAYGFPVLGLDVSQRQVEKALKLGLQEGAVIGQDDVEKVASVFSDGQGVDAVIITAATKSNEPVELAGRICRDKGQVSAVGDVKMDIPRNIYYEKELDFRISRSYGPGRYDPDYEEKGIDYPIGYVRWTEKRNMEQFLRLISIGHLDVKPMITHIFKIEDALKAYELILENPNKEDFTAVLLEYDPAKEHKPTVILTKGEKRVSGSDVVNVGLIGGGGFAKSTILPNLKKLDKVRIKAVATATGRSAKDIAKKYGCEYATTDYREILHDEDIHLVIIATRHNLHVPLTIEALKRGKNVHVEKPLALNMKQLKAVIEAERDSQGRLIVGFNRRFAIQTSKAKKLFSKRKTPLMIHYRINAGYIPPDHWVHDPVQGGGRIIGEVCHFVDFLQFVTGAAPERVYATKISGSGNVISEDNVNITIDFVDGSRGSILYTALGSKSMPKEYIEIFGNGKNMIINNFKTGSFLSLTQDKGHYGEFKAFIEAILNGKPSPISVADLALTTLVTFKIHESLKQGEPMPINLAEVTGVDNGSIE
jgi:predicted dehydrogenase/threonine dehydrogenase-like Zn-dependent dehydrogenase